MNKSSKTGKSYKKGDTLLIEKPFVFALKSQLHAERCDSCLERNQLLKCAGCNFVRYCDRACQKTGWTIHKYECHNMKRIHPKVLPDSARLLSRIVIKLNKDGRSEKSYYSDSKFRTFWDLMSHYNEIKKDKKRTDHFTVLNEVLQEYLQDQLIPNSAELLAIYGKMVINTFNILDHEMQSIGSGLYLGASVIDHSCSPNAVAVFDGPNILIRTLQDIPSLDWSKVYISYIELVNLPSVRQKELESSYYFLCQCERCLSIEEVNCMGATICQNDGCKGVVWGGMSSTTAKCSNCDQVISQQGRDKIDEVVKFTEGELSKMAHVTYLDICRMCLKKQEGVLHSGNIYRVKVLDLAMECCITMENWEGALEYGQQMSEPFCKYSGDLHPLKGIFLMKLGKISMLLNRENEARKCFKEAAAILTTTHGVRHSLIQELLNYMEQCQ